MTRRVPGDQQPVPGDMRPRTSRPAPARLLMLSLGTCLFVPVLSDSWQVGRAHAAPVEDPTDAGDEPPPLPRPVQRRLELWQRPPDTGLTARYQLTRKSSRLYEPLTARGALTFTPPDRLELRVSTNGSCNPGTTATDVGDFQALVTSVNPTLERGGYPEDRLIRKKNGSFRHGMNVAGKTKLLKVGDESRRETRGKPSQLFRRKPQALKKIERLFQPSRNHEISPQGKLANKKLEHRGFFHALLDVALQHHKLIMIRQ